eukprot:3268709-Rhodomonas_salina.2
MATRLPASHWYLRDELRSVHLKDFGEFRRVVVEAREGEARFAGTNAPRKPFPFHSRELADLIKDHPLVINWCAQTLWSRSCRWVSPATAASFHS